jgi:hypothetical protein
LEALAVAELTPADLAVATGAHPRTAASWFEDPETPPRKNEHRRRLSELKEVLQFMVANGTIAYQEADWLRHPNRLADFQTPLELIGEGEWKRAVRIFCDDVAAKVPKEYLDDDPQGSSRSDQTMLLG